MRHTWNVVAVRLNTKTPKNGNHANGDTELEVWGSVEVI